MHVYMYGYIFYMYIHIYIYTYAFVTLYVYRESVCVCVSWHFEWTPENLLELIKRCQGALVLSDPLQAAVASVCVCAYSAFTRKSSCKAPIHTHLYEIQHGVKEVDLKRCSPQGHSGGVVDAAAEGSTLHLLSTGRGLSARQLHKCSPMIRSFGCRKYNTFLLPKTRTALAKCLETCDWI